ncbi:serine hydrolase domain-containing protein [Kribbella sp. CA-245084]|uniref:serine hydrolase domain-containing protein n=1 Tax=Kribbella sp. CA-245084 TaxID=3239940 RepID=UPI003D93B6C3
MATTDDRMTGFPPSDESLVDLSGWQDAPNVRWAFRHMRELMPTHAIPGDPEYVRPLPSALDPSVCTTPVTRLDGSTATADDVWADTWTDALLVLHNGTIVDEQYLSGMTPHTPHLLMSVSKSIVGCVAGILVQRGVIDPDAAVTKYVPEVEGSGYGGATVRHVLDMRTGVAFRETYQAADAEVRVMERSMGWRPPQDGDPVGAYNYLTTLGTASEHGGPFTYRSADTDLLGWVCERATGTRMADLVSRLVWIPMGAECAADITCDPVGTAVHDGGISAVARDVARFGQLLLDGHIVPPGWLDDAWHPPADVRDAFAGTDNEPVLPGGWYRNQFWFVPNHRGTALVCLGIHGQMVYVHRETRTVGVKLSSWPDPQNASYLIDTLRTFAAIGAALDG